MALLKTIIWNSCVPMRYTIQRLVFHSVPPHFWSFFHLTKRNMALTRNCKTLPQTVRSTPSLFKAANSKSDESSTVQKPNWTRFMGNSENVYSGTRTFWFLQDRTYSKKSVYRSTHLHFCPSSSVHFGFCTKFVWLNKLFAPTARATRVQRYTFVSSFT